MTVFILLLIGFAAGFLDSIVGGGGLIATPALANLYPSWHILNVIGTNRTSSIFGTSVAAWNYFRQVPLEKRIVLPACGGALAASYLGIQLAKSIPAEPLKWAVIGVIFLLAVYSLFKKDLGQAEKRRFGQDQEWIAAMGVGMACGFYNGLIGPGTGTLLVFAFVRFIGLDFLKGSAAAKAVNVSGDLSSWIVLAFGGFVMWWAALPLVVSNMAGSYLGSRMAILRGSEFIRWVFLAVVFALIGRLIWQVMVG